MPSSTAIGARVVLPFREQDVERKKDDEKDADFNHGLRNVRPECLLQIVRMLLL